MRRYAALLVAAGIAGGALLIFAYEHYQSQLIDWLLAEPQVPTARVVGAMLCIAVILVAPLVASGLWFWRLGTRVLAAGTFPPPGYRVIVDTPVVEGSAARIRGAGLRILAGGVWVAAIVTCLLLWGIAQLLLGRGA